MSDNTPFQPDWLSPPGATIADLLASKGISLAEFSCRIEVPTDELSGLFDGSTAIASELALLLERALGPSAKFWLDRDRNYRRTKPQARLPRLAVHESDWLKQFPLTEMAGFGWLKSGRHTPENYQACLDFFGVSSPEVWQSKYSGELSVAAFRTSATYQSNQNALLAWLRQSEIQSSRITCAPWNPERFRASLQELRRLTWVKSPSVFLPRLQQECAKCGVALTITRAPRSCKVSGATRFLSPKKAMIALSFRYLSDDHFWFTFYHEAGHLILHDMDALFLEDESCVTAHEEAEANEFASEMLVSAAMLRELAARQISAKSILAFARQVGVSPGIVVGQMQHQRMVERSKLNHLKRRYSWQGVDDSSAPLAAK
ncbi:MAG: ImmA/IrrE family metallo-endopeptidase [Proteobacteria bacterium]|nr:ImmA/IrrE family metallo-endopeptidase [Pseudomonadota bacterium]